VPEEDQHGDQPRGEAMIGGKAVVAAVPEQRLAVIGHERPRIMVQVARDDEEGDHQHQAGQRGSAQFDLARAVLAEQPDGHERGHHQPEQVLGDPYDQRVHADTMPERT
jgi:hypothetical protein